jgi:ATP-binding cassette subfamily B protein RaxB
MTLRREHPISLRGTTLKDISEIANSIGLSARAVRCELDELRHLRAPAILHWNLDHFVVLKSANRGRAVIFDPARGRATRRLRDISGNFTGVALELSPTARFQRRRERQPLRLLSLIKPDLVAWQVLIQGLALSVLFQVFVLINPYFMQIVIDEAILKADVSLLGAVAAGFALLKVFEVATIFLRGLVFQFLSSALSLDAKASLFHHMIRLPLSYFQRRHVGDIQQRFQSLQPITDFLVNGAIAVLIDGVLAVLVAVLLFLYDSSLALIAFGSLLLYAALRLALLGLSMRLAGDLLVAQARESTKFLETLHAMQTIKVAAGETSRENGWRNLAADVTNGHVRVGNVNIAFWALSQAVLGLSTIAIVYIAAGRVIGAEMTVGMITAFIAYKLQLEQRLTALIEQYVNWRLLDVHLERVADIALNPREEGIEVSPSSRALVGALDLLDVSFRYAPHEPDVLRGFSASIRPGEFVAIVGPSGAGKSTLLKIMTGLYAPTSGRLLVDGLPSEVIGPRTIRSCIGAVMQDDTLLEGTIAENIAMFDERIDMDRVVAAARTACIHEHIECLPMAYKSLVGDMGSSLSGGQQQRVMLARALYRNPKILVLDEGTAHLDAATEAQVNANLRALQITRIVVAHRMETVQSADRTIEIIKGSAVTPSDARSAYL